MGVKLLSAEQDGVASVDKAVAGSNPDVLLCVVAEVGGGLGETLLDVGSDVDNLSEIYRGGVELLLGLLALLPVLGGALSVREPECGTDGED